MLRPQWMPETTDHTMPCMYYVFPDIYIPMNKYQPRSTDLPTLITASNRE